MSRLLYPNSPVRRAKASVLFAAGLCFVLGCAVTPPRPEDRIAPPERFSASGADAVPDRWWEVFEIAALSGRIDTALAGNFDLEAAWLRLAEARALVRRESAPLLPTLDGTLDAETRRGGAGGDDSLGLGLAAGYELDLWGRIGAEVDAEAFRAEAEEADYRAAALTLSAEVALTHFGIAEASEQLDLLDQQVEANERIRELIRTRVASGQLRSVDLLRQEELLEATKEHRIVASARRQVLSHQMAVLLGEPVGEKTPTPSAALPDLPPLPATGLPAELVRRRPDIDRAQKLVLAADRDLAAAMSSRYPRLNLTAMLTTTDDSSGDLFRDWARSFAAGLLQPIFDGGRREAEVDRTTVVRDRRLAEYGQAVLESFREVEDALVREEEQRQRLASLSRQLSLSGETIERIRTDYFSGVGDYHDVLTALTDEQQLRRDRIAARLLLVESRIALYRALAGGFETPREKVAQR